MSYYQWKHGQPVTQSSRLLEDLLKLRKQNKTKANISLLQ